VKRSIPVNWLSRGSQHPYQVLKQAMLCGAWRQYDRDCLCGENLDFSAEVYPQLRLGFGSQGMKELMIGNKQKALRQYFRPFSELRENFTPD
jgi:hypothetical protein